MRVGLIEYAVTPLSVEAYRENIVHQLKDDGIEFVNILKAKKQLKSVDIIWDPRAGRGAPNSDFLDSGKPIVATYHGAAPIKLPIWEAYSKTSYLKGLIDRYNIKNSWRNSFKHDYSIITVSKYAKEELLSFTNGGLKNKFTVIYHGVDHHIFKPASKPSLNYLLHVSSYQPKKNINRIIAAYTTLKKVKKDMPPLVVVSPNYQPNTNPPGVKLITEKMTHAQLVDYYQNAICLIYPSLHETFGMPILEAMACGCPVVTSNCTACTEVAGSAAHLVDPRSVNEIAEAMQTLSFNDDYARSLSSKGIQHSAEFTWLNCANQHRNLFYDIVGK